jgi:hypothetical protein
MVLLINFFEIDVIMAGDLLLLLPTRRSEFNPAGVHVVVVVDKSVTEDFSPNTSVSSCYSSFHHYCLLNNHCPNNLDLMQKTNRSLYYQGAHFHHPLVVVVIVSMFLRCQCVRRLISRFGKLCQWAASDII